MPADLEPPASAGVPADPHRRRAAARGSADTAPGAPSERSATAGPEAADADGSAGADRAEPTGTIARGRAWATGEVERAGSWFERRRVEAMPFDLAAMYYERDRDSFASVLGAALAMRLFLFLVPFLVFWVGILLVLRGPEGIDAALDGASITGTMAEQIRQASPTSRSSGLVLIVTGLWLSLWAGRSLTKVLASCSAGAWRITGRASRATLRMAGTVTGLILLLLLVTAFLNRARERFSLPVATTSWIAAAAVVGVGWFLVSWSLPRRTTDPGALLPGAVLMGLAMSALQWFMQYYLPGRVERASELVGSIGVSLAALGYLFIVGRLMAATLILNAVVWERVGSISGFVFALPVVRILPRRSARLRRFFDLDGANTDGASEAAPSEDPPSPSPERG